MYRDRADWGVFFILGTLLGAFLALMFGTDEQGNTKKTVKTKIKQTKDGMKEIKEQHIDPVVEVFEEKTREARAKFEAALSELEDRLAKLKTNIKELDGEKYRDVVDEVMADLKKSGNYTTDQLGRLKSYFVNDYKHITSGAAKRAK